LKDLIIRTAVVLGPQYGVIYACDPKLERRSEPHTIYFLFNKGKLDRGEYNFDAHSVCLIDRPDKGTVIVSEAGHYSAETNDDEVVDDIFARSSPPPTGRRSRGIRSVQEVGGLAHAIGIRGMVYRLDALDRWTRIDEGLPSSFDGQAIDGFGVTDVFAVGMKGGVWHYDGKTWTQQDIPTNRNLTAARCTPDGTVYFAGHGGTLVRGQRDQWSLVDHGDMAEDIWDLEWFAGKLYVSTLDGLFCLQGDHLHPVAYGKQTPRSTYQLSTYGGAMWSNGETSIMEFDGMAWTRIV
jgi:hypothetical protein